VDRLVVASDDIQGDVALQLTQRQRGMALRVILAAVFRIAERRAGQEVQLAHLRADQPLDMATIAGSTRRAPINADTGILASTLEGAAAEVSAIVHMQHVGQARHGPGLGNLALAQPGRLVEDGMQKAQARRKT
jgi:hypothetical protein